SRSASTISIGDKASRYLAQGGQPLSKTTFQRPSASRRQIELKIPTCFPSGSRTGPLVSASVPESSTSTLSGSQENGALAPSKKAFQPATTADFPRRTPELPKNNASSATYDANASGSRAAMVCANAVSAARTCDASTSLVWLS